jgi:hypothetical protein
MLYVRNTARKNTTSGQRRLRASPLDSPRRPESANGMVQPCSCLSSDKLAGGTRSCHDAVLPRCPLLLRKQPREFPAGTSATGHEQSHVVQYFPPGGSVPHPGRMEFLVEQIGQSDPCCLYRQVTGDGCAGECKRRADVLLESKPACIQSFREQLWTLRCGAIGPATSRGVRLLYPKAATPGVRHRGSQGSITATPATGWHGMIARLARATLPRRR